MDDRHPKRRKDKYNPYTLSLVDGKCYLSFKDGQGFPHKLELDVKLYANIIVMGAILAVAFGASKLIDYIPGHITESAEKFFAALEDNGIVVLSAVIAVAALLLSYICSRRIMAKKEF